MIRSFLNTFLPEDEYKRMRILYFMAETTFFSVIILFLLGFLKYIFNINLDTEFILVLTPPLMLAYTYFRYVFAGIEYTEVSNKNDYMKRRRVASSRSLFMGVMFSIIFFIVKGIPNNWNDGIDLIAMPIIFTVLYFIFEMISLNRSYKQNKDLTDD